MGGLPATARGDSSFNPCFDGSVARGVTRASRISSRACFNPCFDGSVARGVYAPVDQTSQLVSILVLMEV